MSSRSKHHFSKKQLRDYQKKFDLFDRDGDGTISVRELGPLMKELGQPKTDKQLKEMIRNVDKDRNGDLDFGEFCDLMMAVDKEKEEAEGGDLRKEFMKADADGNGKLNAKELKRLMRKFGQEMSDQDIHEMIQQADTDGDGDISWPEFKCMF